MIIPEDLINDSNYKKNKKYNKLKSLLKTLENLEKADCQYKKGLEQFGLMKKFNEKVIEYNFICFSTENDMIVHVKEHKGKLYQIYHYAKRDDYSMILKVNGDIKYNIKNASSFIVGDEYMKFLQFLERLLNE